MQNQVVYVSAVGLEKLKEELHYLRDVKRKQVSDRIEKAKDLGDLKENAEYHDAKDQMGMLMGRVRQLEDQIARAKVVEKGDNETVGIGSVVKVDCEGKEKSVEVVGPTEADPSGGKISNESPLGRALIGRRVGDRVSVTLPAGERTYEIREID